MTLCSRVAKTLALSPSPNFDKKGKRLTSKFVFYGGLRFYCFLFIILHFASSNYSVIGRVNIPLAKQLWRGQSSSNWKMRYLSWDVLLFPAESRVPIQEFKTACYAVVDSEIMDGQNGRYIREIRWRACTDI